VGGLVPFSAGPDLTIGLIHVIAQQIQEIRVCTVSIEAGVAN